MAKLVKTGEGGGEGAKALQEQRALRRYRLKAYAPHTLRAYAASWRCYEAWCAERGVSPGPVLPEQLAMYLVYLAEEGRKASTILRHAAALRMIHETREWPFPHRAAEVRTVVRGILRSLGTAQEQKRPLLLEDLRRVLASIPRRRTLDIRDRALLVIGWAGALRRSELVGLRWSDLQETPQGLILLLRRSKTDPLAKGQQLAILRGKRASTCPVRLLLQWRALAGDGEYVFRAVSKAGRVLATPLDGRDVARILKQRLAVLDYPVEAFAGHSLRAGFITTAARQQVPDYIILKHSRHKTYEMLKRYTRDQALLKDNPTGMVGL